ncbi:hypothetical protein GCM10025880_22370 [Methylorubrum aminovorans]|nr:hypothetical protein GCM10025880_22370 [Methylorubrum aminovorans]
MAQGLADQSLDLALAQHGAGVAGLGAGREPDRRTVGRARRPRLGADRAGPDLGVEQVRLAGAGLATGDPLALGAAIGQ